MILLRGISSQQAPPGFTPALLALWGWIPTRRPTLDKAEGVASFGLARLLLKLSAAAAAGVAEAKTLVVLVVETGVVLYEAIAEAVATSGALLSKLTAAALHASHTFGTVVLAVMRVLSPHSGQATIGEILRGRARLR